MDVPTQIDQLRARGVDIRLEGDSLKATGRIGPKDDLFFREHKPAIIQHLRGSGSDCYEQMRSLAPLLGREVLLDGRTVKLWGLTPHGAIIDNGLFKIAVDFDSVSAPC